MYWRRKKTEQMSAAAYEPLAGSWKEGCLESSSGPKGHIPVIVGCDRTNSERFLLPLRLFKDPCISVLLEMAEQEYGYQPQGALRLYCDAEHFRQVVDEISKHR